MRMKHTIVLEVFADDTFDPGSIQDIANEVEWEEGEGKILSVESVPDPNEEGEEEEEEERV